MRSLFLGWRAPKFFPGRPWFPIGLLDVEKVDEETIRYRFRYTQGAMTARNEVGFDPLLSFPDFERDYESENLFPLFKNRVLSHKRSDFAEFVSWLDLKPEDADPILILAVSGGNRATDNMEVFPKVVPAADGSFNVRFFLHGIRHLGEKAIERAKNLVPGEVLRIMVEVNNPATRLAVPLLTADYTMIGWAPRYLVHDLVTCVPSAPEITATVAKVNHGHAPLNQSILIDYAGRAPDGHGLMMSPDLTPLIS